MRKVLFVKHHHSLSVGFIFSLGHIKIKRFSISAHLEIMAPPQICTKNLGAIL
jgi:high-affinity nickel permease